MTQSLHKETDFKNIIIYPIFFSIKVCYYEWTNLNKWKITCFFILKRVNLTFERSLCSSLPFPTGFKFWNSGQQSLSNPQICSKSKKKNSFCQIKQVCRVHEI